ncbi:hydroxylamine reductase [Megalodesulfovibrio gigas]|uniref:Hydroxylamine reductase n=1 Tax=Megalodesulfovibrio gigas (strain ATCC 19364 / DSM 1382 / NCIMB 9332 / VKM B-1759) TaxID=1121448 RepID=T2GAY2_MEGG1|nr:hydroxylamine reductase [Megalodesulfovibrio gigas]AGW13339.1 putative hydroxylamine reductase [Megalodesulfovibrio gigas DSM 1382 = ATCC 19364]
MFCYQCEQTNKSQACTTMGVCGKKADVAALQDLTVYALKGLAQVASAGREAGVVDPAVGPFMVAAMFSTLTNVNFDPQRFQVQLNELVAKREALKIAIKAKNPGVSFPAGPADFQPAVSLEDLVKQGEGQAIPDHRDPNPDIESLKQTCIYGIKGVAAYADHAYILGQQDDAVYAYIEKALSESLTTDKDLGFWVNMAMECGQANLKAMELLDAANTGAYGHPTPVSVPLGHRKNKCILVSGHDLHDLYNLLQATEGKGIDIYTHGEMLPCHGYPKLKEFKHFYGHFGTAWQNQQREFAEFPGAILMTTNCIQKPAATYMDHIFTTGLVGWPGATHVPNGDFSAVIEKALAMPGFTDDLDKGAVLTGFARNAVLGVADKVIDAVKSGAIKHFFLVAGCDGAKPGRNYYTEFVEKLPQDTVVLTLACGKFRFFDKQLGDIDGIPRLLDVGQCNDAYSAIQIAVALAGAFNCGVNDLPLSMVLSWYEQKAVAILLTLLSLGIKNIRLGPTLPAFLTPNVLNFLVEQFNIMPISTPDEDIKAILGSAA